MFQRGLILSPSVTVRCDDARVGGPVVRWNPARNLWSLWYYARSKRFAPGLAPAFGTGVIALAESEDGRHWRRVEGGCGEGAVMAPSAGASAFDSRHIGTGDVVHWQGRWLMAYFAGNEEAPAGCASLYCEPGYLLRIGLASSADGMSWQRLSGEPVVGPGPNEVYAGFPGLVADSDQLYLHYTVVDPLGSYYRTRLLRSVDAVRWQAMPDPFFEVDAPLHETGGIITRDILPSPEPALGRWLMLYTARDGRAETAERRSIGIAVSDDMLSWRRLWREPIFTVGIRGAWDSGGVANPRLVITESEYRLYYYGWSNESSPEHPLRGIGLATAPRAQGIEGLRAWRRVMSCD